MSSGANDETQARRPGGSCMATARLAKMDCATTTLPTSVETMPTMARLLPQIEATLRCQWALIKRKGTAERG